MVWTVSAGHSCLGSQANSRCPSFPAHHCTSGSLLPAAVTRLATSCSGASQELRPQQAPSSQQANSPLKYCCLAVFSRLQSRESAERIAIRGAHSPRPTMLRGGAGTSPHLPPPTQGTSAPACPANPGAHPTTATHDGDTGGGARPAAGRWGGRGPRLRPRGRADPAGRPPSLPAAQKAQPFINYLLLCEGLLLKFPL